MLAQRGLRRPLLVSGVMLLVTALVGIGLGMAITRDRAPTISASNPVEPVDTAVPNRIAAVPLLDQSGHEMDLAAFHGRIVVLADFMTSCQEECPITTGALLSVNQALAAAHLNNKVTIVEVSLDPWRDIPSRLLAYSKMFGVPFMLLTGSKANIAKLWSWFGVFYERVKEGAPPYTNWETGKPYTFDIVHSDDVFVLAPSGRLRALVQGNANVADKLPKSLARLLSGQGRQDLKNPGLGSWTPTDMLQAIGSVLGKAIPIS